MKKFTLSTCKSTFLNFYFVSLSFLMVSIGWGQTNPTAHNLASSNFSFTGFSSGATTTYPTSMQGHKFSAERTTTNLTGVANGDMTMVGSNGLIATGSIRNEVTNGISLLNSGSINIGAICVSVNSTGRNNLLVSWKAQQLNSGGSGATDRINGLRLQYRVGTSGSYENVASTEYLTTNTSSQNAEVLFSNIELPSACNNQAEIQLRWIYYISGGTANGRDRIRLDDITVSSTATPQAAPPSLTAASSPTVDAAFNVTFTEDLTWRTAISSITVGGTTLATSAYSTATSGQITFTPSLSTLLQSSGSISIVVSATGYNNATVIQSLGAGAANKLAITTQPASPATNGAVFATQPVIAIQDQYGNLVSNSSASVAASASQGTWTLGGTISQTGSSGIATFTNLTASSSTSVSNASIAFSSSGLTGVTSGTFNIVAPAPANDLCSSPSNISVNASSIAGTTVSATYSTLSSEPFTAYADVWYTFTTAQAGNVTITTSNSGVDYDIYVYSICPTSAPSNVTGGSAANGGNSSETLTFEASSSSTYLIRVVNTTSAVGNPFTIQVTQPVPTITSSGTLSALSTTYGLPSSNTSFSLSGANMTAGITVTPPTGFEVSTSATFASGIGTYSNPIIIGSTGTISSTTVYVRLAGTTAVGDYSGNIVLTSPGASTVNVATVNSTVSPAPSTPTLSISGSLSVLSSTYGTASSSTSFTITGTALEADVHVSSLSGFELATSNTGPFSSSLSLTPTNNSLNQTVYIRLSASSNAASYSGNLTISSTNAISQTISIPSSVIAKKALSITTPSVASKEYDGQATTGALTLGTLSGFIGSETVTATGTTSNYSNLNVGTSKSTTVTYTLIDGLNGGLASNYSLSNSSISTGVISKKTLSISTPSIADKIYNGSQTSGSVTVGTISGLVGLETVIATAVGAYNDANAGTNKQATITYTLQNGSNGGLATNYSLAQGSASGNISTKPLTITANNGSKTYGSTFTTGSGSTAFTSSGLISPQTIGSVTISSLGAVGSANVGSYSIVPSTATGGTFLAANYSITYVNGTLTVNQKPLTITTPTVASKQYDGQATPGALTIGSLSGFVGTETVTAVGSASNFSNANVGTNKTTSVSYVLSDGTNGGLASNYSLANSASSGNITTKPLSISAAVIADKNYDGTTTTGSVTPGVLSGLVGTQTLSVSAVGAFNDANVGTNKLATITYTLSNGLNGGIATNYSLATTTATGNVNIADQTISGLSSTDTKTTATSTYSLGATASSGLTVTYTSSNAAVATISGSIVTITGIGTTTIIASQGGNGNYNPATNLSQELTVLQAPDVIFSNTITGTNPNTSNPYTTGQIVISNVTVGGISRGSGITGSSANDRYSASGWNATSLNSNKYFEFSITPDPVVEIDFYSLVYTSQASGTGPISFALRSSIDNFTSDIATPSVSGTTVSLTDLPFQNISNNITFRIYAWNTTNSGGTFSINDFAFYGYLDCVVPTTITQQPTSTAQNGLSGANLSVAATGAGLTYQWYSNTTASNVGGIPINNATNATYNTAPHSTLFYYCVVTGTCGSVTSEVSGAVSGIPTTTLSNASCGTTLSSLGWGISASNVSNAAAYEFQITDPSAGVFNVVSPDRWITLSEATGMSLLYGSNYSIKVRVQSVTGTWGNYGSACNVNTPSIPATVLSNASCGNTLPSIGWGISATNVAAAAQYMFEITAPNNATPYEVTSSDRWITLSEATGMSLLYASNYSIRVKVQNGTGVWGNFGTACTVTTPSLPTTTLSTASCGTTLPSIGWGISATNVAAAAQYMFEITAPNNATPYEVSSIDRWITLSEATGMSLLYASNYSIRVKVQNGTGDWGNYGTACTVSTPSLPTTTLSTASCGTTLPSIGWGISATNVAAAAQYMFEITAPNNATPYEVSSADRWITLSEATGMSLLYEDAYSIRVKVQNGNGDWSGYAGACTVTTPDIPVISLSTTSCGATLPSLGWGISATNVAAATQYEFEITAPNGNVYSVLSPDRWITLSEGTNTTYGNLVPTNNQTYLLKVRAQSGSNWGLFDELPCQLLTPQSQQVILVQDPQAHEEATEGIVSQEEETLISQLNYTWSATATSNPFEHSFKVNLNGAEDIERNAIFTATLTDMSGKVYTTHTLSKEALTEEYFGQDLAPGMYLMTLRQGEELRVLRVVKR